MKRFSSWAISVMAMGLFVTPVKAQTGNVQGIHVETVVCFNRTTGVTAPGTLSSVNDTGEFDCSGVGPGEIGILLLGQGEPASPCGGSPVAESELNDDLQQAQDIGILSEECNLTVTGNIHTGYDDFDNQNPNRDMDVFVFALDGVSQLRLTMQLTSASEWSYGVFDAATNERLQCQPGAEGIECVVPVQTTSVFVRVGAQNSTDYTLTISGGANGGSQPFGTSAHGIRRLTARQLWSVR